MLSDPERFSEEIEDLLENLSSEDGWMIIGDPQRSVLDGLTVTVCNHHAISGNYTPPGLAIILPNKGSQLFTPVPVHLEQVDLAEAYQEGHFIYLYLALLAHQFVVGSQSPLDNEPLEKAIQFLMDTHDKITASLSHSYTPDDDNTTTKVLGTIQYLIMAIWKGFRDGMFNPELARFGGMIPAGHIPKGRVSFEDYDLPTALRYSGFRNWSSSNPDEIQSDKIRIIGDLCKSLCGKFIKPIEHILKGDKQQTLNMGLKDNRDRNNLIYRYQLYLFLKILYPKTVLQEISNILFDSPMPPNINLDVTISHRKSTKALYRISEYKDSLIIPSDEFNTLIKIFAVRCVLLIHKQGKNKADVVKKLITKGPDAFADMRKTIEFFLNSKPENCPRLFETGPLGNLQEAEPINKTAILTVLKAKTVVPALASTPNSTSNSEQAETAIVTVLTPHERLLKYGLPKELAHKFPSIKPWESIPNITSLEELGIDRIQTMEITKVVFKHWDNPDTGVREVLKMLNMI